MSTPGRESTRQAILESCRRVVEQSGPDSWTMENVAAHAQVTRMTVYRYFPSRTQLLVETVRWTDEMERMHERFASVHESPTALDALARWVDVWMEYVPRVHRLAQALLTARRFDEAAAEAWNDRMTAVRDGCRHIVERLRREEILSSKLSVDTATDLMWAIASVHTWEDLTEARSWNPRRYSREMTRALVRVLTGD